MKDTRYSAAVWKAVELLPATCRYHGTDWEQDMWQGQPMCETCRRPYWRQQALLALNGRNAEGWRP